MTLPSCSSRPQQSAEQTAAPLSAELLALLGQQGNPHATRRALDLLTAPGRAALPVTLARLQQWPLLKMLRPFLAETGLELQLRLRHTAQEWHYRLYAGETLIGKSLEIIDADRSALLILDPEALAKCLGPLPRPLFCPPPLRLPEYREFQYHPASEHSALKQARTLFGSDYDPESLRLSAQAVNPDGSVLIQAQALIRQKSTPLRWNLPPETLNAAAGDCPVPSVPTVPATLAHVLTGDR